MGKGGRLSSIVHHDSHRRWHAQQNLRAVTISTHSSQVLPQPVLDNRAASNVTYQSPSETLVAALEDRGYAFATPTQRKNKLDYTWVPPPSSRLRRGEKVSSMSKRVHKTRRAASFTKVSKPTRLRLQTILSRFLHLVPARGSLRGSADDASYSLDHGILQVFDDEAIASLSSRGYDASDVLVWAWIVTAETSEQAALRLLLVSTENSGLCLGFETKRIPAFLFLFLLRRSHITAPALRLFIVHAWHLLGSSNSSHDALLIRHNVETEVPVRLRYANDLKGPPAELRKYPKLCEQTIVIMVIRLLRFARKLWPAALVSISAMLTTHLVDSRAGHLSGKPLVMDEKKSARLSFYYNKVLHLLALPSPQHPYRAVPYHQRAQFKLISRMNEFEPALTINKEGYHAVVRIQLAHRKILRERDWAGMKAKSWPPWKVDKVGIDADVGIDSGISRAKESLSRLSEAGYGSQSWEAAASILSGWDTDQSPTIQTRTVYPQSSVRHRHPNSDIVQDQVETDEDVWAARLRATRTLHEAWACFLAHKDQRLAPSLTVYHAMFERLVFDTQRRRREAKIKSVGPSHLTTITAPPELSGEGKEVSRPPSDPRDGIYVRIPPPNINDFFDSMLADGIKPAHRCLAFILSHATSIREGEKYLKSSSLPRNVVTVLLGHDTSESPEKGKLLKELPHYLFAAHIRFLTRFGSGRAKRPSEWNYHLRQSTRRDALRNPLQLAFGLLYACEPSYRPPWYSLLSALINASTRFRDGSSIANRNVEEMALWNAILGLLDRMRTVGLELDFEGFQKMCIAFEKAIQAAQKSLIELHEPISTLESNSDSWNVILNHDIENWDRARLVAENIVTNGPRKLKALFRRLVVLRGGEADTWMDDTDEKAPGIQSRGTMEPHMLLPKLLEVPSPAELHAFIRALGLGQDHDGLYALVKWMACYALDLKAVADELRNGSIMTRRCLVALRAFLDGSWHDLVMSNGLQGEGVPSMVDGDLVEKVRVVIEGTEEWGGWPTDDEVEDYCTKGRAPESDGTPS